MTRILVVEDEVQLSFLVSNWLCDEALCCGGGF